MRLRLTTISVVFIGLLAAMPAAAVSTLGIDALRSVYERRSDLQSVFSVDWGAKSVAAAGEMESLEEWARLYGWREHPSELKEFSPDYRAADDPQDDLGYPNIGEVNLSRSPKIKAGARFNFNNITADKVLVIDVASRDTLLARRANDTHELASLSKLMTAKVVLDAGVSMWGTNTIQADDEVGGARLRVPVGSSLYVRNLFDAALVGSANNAAHALARSTGLSIPDFVSEMNRRASAMRLVSTHFVDPTGIELGNTSNAVDVARMAYSLFDEYEIRRATTTAKTNIPVGGEQHMITNTNGLLTDPNNGLYVMGGKTGYLIEAGWNLAVKLRDYRNREIIVVVLGSDTQKWSFNDAAYLSRWVWDNYRWPS